MFLRCAGLAGDAFFTLADSTRTEIEPRLRAEIGPEATMEWGTSHHPGMTDIAAILAARATVGRPCGPTANQVDASERCCMVALLPTRRLAVPGEAGTCREHRQVGKEAV